MKKIKNTKGITLIALVVTIIILLILAGVSISMLTGNEGIIAKANEAKMKYIESQIEEEWDLWNINKKMNEDGKSLDDFIDELIDKGIITEDDADKTKENLIGISIKKYPENQESYNGYLKVILPEESSIKKISNKSNYRDYVDTKLEKCTDLDIEKMKDYIKELIPQFLYRTGMSEENLLAGQSIDNFVNSIPPKNVLDSLREILYVVPNNPIIGFWDETTKKVYPYYIKNPAEESKIGYMATENGNYTFKITDISNDDVYSKTINVTDIKENNGNYELKKLTERDGEYIEDSNIKIIEYFGLVNNQNQNVKIDGLSIIFGNEKIDLTNAINEVLENHGENNIEECWKIIESNYIIEALLSLGKIEGYNDLNNIPYAYVIKKGNDFYVNEFILKGRY